MRVQFGGSGLVVFWMLNYNMSPENIFSEIRLSAMRALMSALFRRYRLLSRKSENAKHVFNVLKNCLLMHKYALERLVSYAMPIVPWCCLPDDHQKRKPEAG